MTENCKHVSKIKTGLQLSILSPERWHCGVCLTTESVWACLSCNNVACGRYISEHALHHYESTNHPLCIEVNEKFVFCYACDDFVLNDNAPGDIKLLRMALDAVSDQDFEVFSKATGGRRILRSQLVNNHKKTKRLIKADDITTAVVKNRASRISFVLRKWYEQLLKKRSQNAADNATLRGMRKRRPLCLYPGFTGLRNLGNTCYMNSVIQVLSRTAPFVNFLTSHESKDVLPRFSGKRKCTLDEGPAAKRDSDSRQVVQKSENGLQGGREENAVEMPGPPQAPPNGNSSLYEEVRSLFRAMWSGQRAVISPNSLLYTLWLLLPAFKGYKQQDAEEFLTIFLDRMRSELYSGSSSTLLNKQDFITRTFYGQLASRITCLQCQTRHQNDEVFSELSLALPSACQTGEVTSTSLTELLDQFIRETPIEGKAYQCPNCNSCNPCGSIYSSATQTIRLTKLPKVLRLHVKRFRWVGKVRDKLSCYVSFPAVLDVSSLIDGQVKAGDSQNLYQLTGVVVHHGRGFQSGHYTCYCLNDLPEAWIHCNDATVNPCKFEEVRAVQAYILFYSELVPASRTPDLRAKLAKGKEVPTSAYWPSDSSVLTTPTVRRRMPSTSMTLTSDEDESASSSSDYERAKPSGRSSGKK